MKSLAKVSDQVVFLILRQIPLSLLGSSSRASRDRGEKRDYIIQRTAA